MKIKNWSKVKEGTLILVTWEDIVLEAGWTGDNEAQNFKPCLCKTVGWFINDDELNIRVTNMVAEDGDKSVAVIPKGVIRDVKKINYER